jgi:hypothetical protein
MGRLSRQSSAMHTAIWVQMAMSEKSASKRIDIRVQNTTDNVPLEKNLRRRLHLAWWSDIYNLTE